MTRSISLYLNETRIDGELNDGAAATALGALLPIVGAPERFGGELYFEVPALAVEEAPATNKVGAGTIAYWPPGACITLYFGPTPLTPEGVDDPIITASAVVPLGSFAVPREVDLSAITRVRITRV